MSGLTEKVMDIGVASILIGALIPVGLAMLSAANTTGWTSSQTVMWGLVGLFMMLGVILAVLKAARE